MKSILKNIITFVLIAAFLIAFSACVTYAHQDYVDNYPIHGGVAQSEEQQIR